MSKAAVGVGVLGVLVAALVAIPRPTFGILDSCNPRWDFSYVNPQSFYQIGDTVRLHIVMGAGSIQGGTHLTISRVRFELDCTTPGVPCTDDGPLVSYLGNIGGTCPTGWSASSVGGTLPNEVVFTADTPVEIPAGVDEFCNLEFDVQITAFPAGTQISEAAGVLAPFNDAVCNTPTSLAVGIYGVGALNMCTCDDGNACTTDICDPQFGCQHMPIPCDDGDACTTDGCDPATGCVFTPIACDDGNQCTTDTCAPSTGCLFTPITCNDSNQCTTDTCNPATGCVFTPPAEICDGTDNNCDGAIDNVLPSAGSLVLTVTKTSLSWTSEPNAGRYDIVRGDLVTLHSSRGNFTTSTNSCLGNNRNQTSLNYSASPTTGNGFWILVRGTASGCGGGNGTYDEGGGQLGSRDAGINASSSSCP